MVDAIGLFDTGGTALPQGFKYQPDLITADEEQQLVRQIEMLHIVKGKTIYETLIDTPR